MVKIALVGYGNIGRGTHQAIEKNNEVYGNMELAGIISRRPEEVKKSVDARVVSSTSPEEWKSLGADVAILCGGSKSDLPIQGPVFASFMNTVDSFDTPKHIHPWVDEKGNYHLGYFKEMDNSARANGNTSITSCGWDPGTFSLERVLGNAFIPGAKAYGFYGLTEQGGLSQGHSDAVRQIPGVKDARQYTHAKPKSIDSVRRGENPTLEYGDMHWREVKVALENDTPEERERVEEAIVTDKNYFAPYKTTVEFVKDEELSDEMPHDGIVIAAGESLNGNKGAIEYKNTWESNPEGTGGILAACARACYRMSQEGKTGSYTMLDVSPALYSAYSGEELRKRYM